MWTIDLHGLHATEAVMALQERLAYLEEELAKNPGFLYSSQRVPNSLSDVKGEGLGVNGLMNGKHEQSLPLAASRAVVKSDLSVITGILFLRPKLGLRLVREQEMQVRRC